MRFMDLKNLPDRRRKLYWRKVTIALTKESFEKVEFLRAQGKNVAEVLRPAIEARLSKVSGKKVG